jgi:ABC-type lipoprotein release transport system permease subunit
MNNIALAWRNLWRNKRRTLITAASVFFGVILATLMSSLQEGTYSRNIDMMVSLSTGYLQIQHPEYKEQRSINNTITPDSAFWNKLHDVEKISKAVPRLESFGLLSYKDKTRAGGIIGIDPKEDDELSNISNWMHKGEYIASRSDGALLTYNIAKHLNISINDTLVILSQGYHGATAAGIYPVKGIVKFNTPQLNNLGVFIDIEQARQLFSAPGKATNIKIMIDDYDNVQAVEKKLTKELGEGYNVLTWRELQPELVQFIESDRQSGALMKLILYLVIGFGILGTVIMMMAERRREFGVMIAIGMQKTRLDIMMFFETIFIGLLGVAAGFAISIPIIYLFINNPIPLPQELAEAYARYGFEPYLFFSDQASVFYNQILTVFIITALVAIYPIWNISKMKASNALRT